MYCIAAGPRQSASVFLNSRVGKKSLGQCNGSFLLSGIDGKKILDPENSLKTWIRPKAFHSFASGKSNRVLQTGARATLDVSILNHFGRSPNSALGFHVTKKHLNLCLHPRFHGRTIDASCFEDQDQASHQILHEEKKSISRCAKMTESSFFHCWVIVCRF